MVHLLAHKDHLVPELTERGIGVTCLEAGGAVAPGWPHRLRRLLRDDPVDIVHVHSPMVAAVTRILTRTLPRRARPAVVGTEHNRWPRHRRATRWANRLTIRLDAATIAVSDDVRSTIRGAPSAQVRTVVHGIDLEATRAHAARDEIRRELGVDPDEVLIVCVANLRREKALDVLVDAASRAVRREPAIRYALVGQGPLAAVTASLVADAGLGERFALLGYRPDAPSIVSGGDVFTLSSRHEGLPVSIMEALALGVPVVATAAGGVPDAVGSAGVIVDIDDAAALAEAHVALARDDARRRALGEAARHEARRFDVRRAVSEIEAVYEMVTSPAAAPPSSQS